MKDPSLFEIVEFYNQDIRALNELGHEVRLAWRLRHLTTRGDDLYWAWWPTSGAPAVTLAWLRRRPAILVAPISDRDVSASGLAAKRGWVRLLARWSFALADRTLAPSEDTRRGLLEYRVRHLQLAPLAVDTDVYTPDPRVQSERLVLSISHLTSDNVERKRVLDIVRTAAELKRRGDAARFVIVGEHADGAKAVAEEIRRLDVGDRVSTPGRIPLEEKLRLLRSASVYFQPTDYESFGMAIAEAMATGTPVVSNAVGAVPELVDGAGVLLPQSATPVECADVIIKLLDRGSRATSEGRNRIVEHFSYEARKRLIALLLHEIHDVG